MPLLAFLACDEKGERNIEFFTSKATMLRIMQIDFYYELLFLFLKSKQLIQTALQDLQMEIYCILNFNIC